jgi:predicted Fe-Mo cluster-binding NifX family protein
MKHLRLLSALFAAFGIVLAAMTASAADGRIAVAAEAAHQDAPVSGVAARAPHILIFRPDGAFEGAYPNPAAANPGGAGPALAGWLTEQRVGTLIAGDFGSKLTQALKEGNIRAVTAAGPASRAVNEARR